MQNSIIQTHLRTSHCDILFPRNRIEAQVRIQSYVASALIQIEHMIDVYMLGLILFIWLKVIIGKVK